MVHKPFYYLLQAEKDPEVFASCIHILGKYHARGIHTWDGGQCDFRDLKIILVVRSCKDDMICSSEIHHTKNPLPALFHLLA